MELKDLELHLMQIIKKSDVDQQFEVFDILLRIIIKFYISKFGSEDSTLLIEQIEDCFDHYQEIANRLGY